MHYGEHTTPRLNHTPNPERWYSAAVLTFERGVHHEQSRDCSQLLSLVRQMASDTLKARVSQLITCKTDWEVRHATPWPHSDLLTNAILRTVRGPVSLDHT